MKDLKKEATHEQKAAATILSCLPEPPAEREADSKHYLLVPGTDGGYFDSDYSGLHPGLGSVPYIAHRLGDIAAGAEPDVDERTLSEVIEIPQDQSTQALEEVISRIRPHILSLPKARALQDGVSSLRTALDNPDWKGLPSHLRTVTEGRSQLSQAIAESEDQGGKRDIPLDITSVIQKCDQCLQAYASFAIKPPEDPERVEEYRTFLDESLDILRESDSQTPAIQCLAPALEAIQAAFQSPSTHPSWTTGLNSTEATEGGSEGEHLTILMETLIPVLAQLPPNREARGIRENLNAILWPEYHKDSLDLAQAKALAEEIFCTALSGIRLTDDPEIIRRYAAELPDYREIILRVAARQIPRPDRAGEKDIGVAEQVLHLLKIMGDDAQRHHAIYGMVFPKAQKRTSDVPHGLEERCRALSDIKEQIRKSKEAQEEMQDFWKKLSQEKDGVVPVRLKNLAPWYFFLAKALGEGDIPPIDITKIDYPGRRRAIILREEGYAITDSERLRTLKKWISVYYREVLEYGGALTPLQQCILEADPDVPLLPKAESEDLPKFVLDLARAKSSQAEVPSTLCETLAPDDIRVRGLKAEMQRMTEKGALEERDIQRVIDLSIGSVLLMPRGEADAQMKEGETSYFLQCARLLQKAYDSLRATQDERAESFRQLFQEGGKPRMDQIAAFYGVDPFYKRLEKKLCKLYPLLHPEAERIRVESGSQDFSWVERKCVQMAHLATIDPQDTAKECPNSPIDFSFSMLKKLGGKGETLTLGACITRDLSVFLKNLERSGYSSPALPDHGGDDTPRNLLSLCQMVVKVGRNAHDETEATQNYAREAIASLIAMEEAGITKAELDLERLKALGSPTDARTLGIEHRKRIVEQAKELQGQLQEKAPSPESGV